MTEFYRSFEDKHRGSRQLILSRLEIYKPFLQELKSRWDLEVLDLGCGRGEWLELLTSLDIRCHGVDLDENMLAACRKRGFKVAKNDAIGFLKELPTASHMAISAFHFVEHIPFEQLQALVLEAKRVLIPGGLLILETPNPENLRVGTCNFYMDPTHVNPLPPALLQFLPDHYGYQRSMIMRLQEPAPIQDIDPVTLMDVFNAVSPDYSVIAQTQPAGEDAPALDSLFSRTFGVTLDEVTAAYDERVAKLEAHAADVVESVNALGTTTSAVIEEFKARESGGKGVLQAVSELEEKLAKTAHEMKVQISSLDLENRALRTTNSELVEGLSTNQQLLAELSSRLVDQEAKIRELIVRFGVTSGRMHALSVIMPSSLVSTVRYAVLQKSLLQRDGVRSRSKSLARKVILSTALRMARYPSVRKMGISVLKKVGAYQYVRARLLPQNVPIFRPSVDTTAVIYQENLSPHARTVLDKLKLAEKTRVRNR